MDSSAKTSTNVFAGATTVQMTRGAPIRRLVLSVPAKMVSVATDPLVQI
jgi:hypothetical protein